MTQPVDPYHRSVWNDLQDPDPFLAPPTPPACGCAGGPAPTAPTASSSTNVLQSTLLLRATVARTTSTAPGGAPPARSPAEIRAGLDAFAASLCPTYHTPSGDVAVQTPYQTAATAVVPAPGSRPMADLLHAAVSIGMSGDTLHTVLLGRGTPAQIRSLTQALIDRGALPGDSRPVEVRIRDMMMAYGIGLDASAYVSQAFLAATGLTASQAHFASPLSESLFQLGARGFARVTPASAQPGDIIVLGRATPQGPGFRAIVYDAHPADAAELAEFAVLVGGHGVPASSGRVTAIEVDSSWSVEGDCDQPGVARTTWYHDEITHVWATMGSPNVVTRGMPFGRPLDGIYRFAGH